jgi:PEGA domain
MTSTFTPTVTRIAAGVAGLLALTMLDPTTTFAQGRGRSAPARHGYHVAAPSRAVVAGNVVPFRGPNRVVVRSAFRPNAFRGPTFVRTAYRPSYVSRTYVSRPFVSRSYAPRYYGSYGSRVVVAQSRHGGVYGRSGSYRPYYRPYYRYPRTFVSVGLGFGYPYGFLGYPFYSPWYGPSWYPGYAWGPGYGYGYGGYGYGYGYGWGGYPGYPVGHWSEYADDQGGIRLDMKPRDAQVYVDGYYAGIVDDFDSSSQHLTLDAGHHKIEVRAPGFETLTLDVNILRRETIRYRGGLRPLQP